MRDDEWVKIFSDLRAETEKELADFRAAIAKHGLRVFKRDNVNGERDVTQEVEDDLVRRIEEYRAALRDT